MANSLHWEALAGEIQFTMYKSQLQCSGGVKYSLLQMAMFLTIDMCFQSWGPWRDSVTRAAAGAEIWEHLTCLVT